MRKNLLHRLSIGLNCVLLILICFFTAGVFFRLPAKYYNQILLPSAVFIVIGLVILIVTRLFELSVLRREERSAAAILKKAGSAAIHFSAILILAAWFLSSFFSRSTYVEGREGSALNLAQYGFAFDVAVTEIRADVYDDGSPEQYATSFAVVKNKEKVAEGNAAVNHPFSYQGAKIYQYGYSVKSGGAVTGLLIKTDPGVAWLYAGAAAVLVSVLLKLAGMKLSGRQVV